MKFRILATVPLILYSVVAASSPSRCVGLFSTTQAAGSRPASRDTFATEETSGPDFARYHILKSALTEIWRLMGITSAGQTVTFPADAKTLNRQIEKFNEVAEENNLRKISLRVYSGDGTIPDETYVERWCEGQIPYTGLHDLFAHIISAVFLPSNFFYPKTAPVVLNQMLSYLTAQQKAAFEHMAWHFLSTHADNINGDFATNLLSEARTAKMYGLGPSINKFSDFLVNLSEAPWILKPSDFVEQFEFQTGMKLSPTQKKNILAVKTPKMSLSKVKARGLARDLLKYAIEKFNI